MGAEEPNIHKVQGANSAVEGKGGGGRTDKLGGAQIPVILCYFVSIFLADGLF